MLIEGKKYLPFASHGTHKLYYNTFLKKWKGFFKFYEIFYCFFL